MKKLLAGTFIAALALAGCGSDEATETNEGNGGTAEEPVTLTIGASNVPHAEILEQAQPLLEEQGIELEIDTYQDYVMPNQDLDAGRLDANFFQHIPYLESQIADHGYDFANAGGIHIEPIGVYSQDYATLEELPDGAVILMSNSIPDHGRILSMLEAEGLITLEEGIDKTVAEISHIVDNPKNLEFDTEYEAALLVQMYESGEGDAVLINSNYAIDAGISPLEDSIALEDSDSPYVNVIAVQAGEENSEAIRTLVDVLHSEEIQQFILDEWGGAVVPAE